MRILAIGDIHGCRRSLVTLLDAVHPAKADQIIFLGDYIDRGPDSPGVINTLLSLKNRSKAIFLRGNHEAMMLDARGNTFKSETWQNCGGKETLISYGAKEIPGWESLIPDPHWLFFEQTIRFFETRDQIFVHGCVAPDLDLNEQSDWTLFWESFSSMRRHKSGKRVICGHTPQPKGLIQDVGFAACIDTGAVFGGWLTCLDVRSNHYWQANEKGEIRQDTLD